MMRPRAKASRAGIGEGLEGEAPREHQGDDRSRGVLADDERRRHGEERDDVDPRLTAPQIADDRKRQRHEHHRRGRRPENVGGDAENIRMELIL